MSEVNGKPEILQLEAVGQDFYVYIRGLQGSEAVKGQIGIESVQDMEWMDNIDVHTIILLDNSLSITEQNQQKIHKILTAYLEGRLENEAVSIAVFGEGIQYLVEKEKDTEVLMECLEQMEYQNQESFLTDVLYEELLKLRGERGYQRFIIATDGVDNKEIGYTKEELYNLLEDKNFPIYSLGCLYKKNTEELKNLFAISRLTGGEYVRLDEVSEPEEVAAVLNEDIYGLHFRVPEASCDGSEKNIRLAIQGEGESIELTHSVKMPFLSVEDEMTELGEISAEADEMSVKLELETGEEIIMESITKAEEYVGEVDTFTISADAQIGQTSEQSVDILTIAAVGVVIASVAVLSVLQILKKGGKKEKEGKQQEKQKKQKKTTAENKIKIPEDFAPQIQTAEKGRDISVENIYGSKKEVDDLEDDEGTISLEKYKNRNTGNSSYSQRRYLVVLKDRNQPDKEFRYPVADQIVLGRKRMEGVDIVLGYDSSVSGKHCRISRIQDQFFIEDLGSTNKTYMNDRIVRTRMELSSGSIIRLGNLELLVDFIVM